MQRRLPEYGLISWCQNLFLLWLLLFAPSGMANAATGSLLVDPFEDSPTMAASIPEQNLLWQTTVKGYLNDPALRLKAPEAKSRPQSDSSAPTRIAARPEALTPTLKSASPFQRWIAPRTSSSAKNSDNSPPSTAPTLQDATTGIITEGSEPDSQGENLNQSEEGPQFVKPQRSEPEIARRTISRSPTSRNGGRRLGEILNPEQSTSVEPQPPAGRAIEEAEETATPLSEYPVPIRDPQPEEEVQVQLPPLTRNQQALRAHVRRVLKYYYDRPLNTRDRSPWELIHAALSYEIYSRVLQGGPDGKPVSAVGWLCFNQSCRNMKLMYINDEGDLKVRVGPALQGHHGQLLAILAQCKVSSEYPMLIDGHEMKVKDLVKAEMASCYPRTELTFKLIGLMHYLDSNTQWVNDQGMQWNLRKLVAEELRQPIRGAACGGTHRLSGLTLAYKARQQRGEPVDGEYLQAQRFVAQHQLYAYRMQNPDGSFSTNWFQGSENKEDIDRKLKTTGHILEWLLYSATDRELKSPRTTKAVYFLTNLMYTNRYRDWEAGPLGHALHALLVYDRLMFSKYDQPGNAPVAIRETLRDSTSR